MSVVKPHLWSSPFEESVPLPSHELPQHEIGPWTIWAASAIGWSTIIAPSKAHDSPPRARQSFSLFSVSQPLCINLSTFVNMIFSLSSRARQPCPYTLSDDIEARRIDRCTIEFFQHRIHNRCHDVQRALIANNRVPVQVVPVEKREAVPYERRTCIAP